MNTPAGKPILDIPSETESSAKFRARLADLIKAADTHIYVDTSFLMWLTKIGSSSRGELSTWLDSHCDGRVHVPMWSAHEYLKHHVAGTIVSELTDKTNEVADLVGRTYSYFRPFIDESYGDGAEDPSTIRAATRAALNSLSRLTTITRQWQRSYQKHSSEVIAFINTRTPRTTSLYDDMKNVAADAALRFVGSVPPGFQDRRKKGSAPHANGNDEAPPDSNRYGDLMFWKELLTHAKTAQARAIVVLTNDRKNDWHLGRSDVVDIDPELRALKKDWKPVPRPHPMLVLEARVVAAVEEVELLDTPYLAALLRDFAEENVRAFADVAIIPDGPEPETENERRTRAIKERQEADAAKIDAETAEKGYLFHDSPAVLNTKAMLSKALFLSRADIEPAGGKLLDIWRASVEARKPLIESLTADAFDGFDQNQLATIARELHDRVLNGVPGFEEAVVDLVSNLDRLPPNTAASLYLGMLASAYLVRQNNQSRIPPSSPIAQFLFERQGVDYAVHAVKAVAKRVGDNENHPLYLPSTERPDLDITLDTQPDTPLIDELRSIKVGAVELLTPAQSDDDLKLSALFAGEDPVLGDKLVRKACELFGLPEAQMRRTEVFGNAFKLTDTIGFKRPTDVSIPKEADLGR
ncbi:MAG TPA: PIN-like domain-containing protein [Mesorhizobium sp.]|jgi:hypothetical protein|uniref:PIN-like domain-containing protein n=1 Tax=Mesorhizobium sp. TaxID=1871066 RepID=UPI002DDD0F2B|nr:PIN-like domain-containing protein [Mesorhizobium sp.]HEV2501857.1 PIN-like domain-containing protein [Mesorhizobium sp.]